MQIGTQMKTKERAEVIFCNLCEKPTYVSAIDYHSQNPCQASMSGWDCMEFEAEEMFCRCEVAA
jgi:hypothetical protein